MSSYFANALIRERIRSWVLKNSGEAPAKQKALRAEVVEAQMKIESTGRRIQDLKAILARYPDAGKLDSRQVVNIAEGQDRFLPPLAQLVAAEAFITQQRETIARKERQARQFDLMERYFAEAGQEIAGDATRVGTDPGPRSALHRQVRGNRSRGRVGPGSRFASRQTSRAFPRPLHRSESGTRREWPRRFRDPVQLGFLGAAAGVGLLALLAFLRVMRTARGEP